MISTVHVVFKTHLDVGFTDLAASVVDRYLHAYLPRAIALAGELEARGGAARFVWTTGSWLIQRALDSASADERARLERAIAAGAIRWHGLPLTTHTEVMDAGLAAHGVSIARRLDARFGMHTIAAKMTDVPGHTIGLVPILARAGIRFLHIGVNGASAVPEVPEFFRWRSPDGSEVVVNYARSYGADALGVAVGPDGRTALHLAHTGDNFGPPSAEDVEHLFSDLALAYPGARIVASTLDAFAADVLAASGRLPVVEDEIGDTWIHGVGSDPLLTAGLRNLLALRTRWVASGALDPASAEGIAFSDALLLVAEHTWGEDLKTFLPDYVDYLKPAFTAARARDVIDPARNPPATAGYAWAYDDHAGRALTFSGFERSWQEQRAYLQRAVEALAPERAAEALAALRALQSVRAAPAAGTDVRPGQEFGAGRFRIRLGEDGSLTALVDESGREYAGDEHRLAAYRYQTFDERDENLWLDQYCRDLDRNGFWAVPDQSKPGLAIAATHPATVFAPRATRAVVRTDGDDDVVSVTLELPAAATEVWGAPRDLRLEYTFPHGEGAIQVELTAAGRDASRLPEASWLGFRPRRAEGAWRLDKLGTLVDPARVVHAGNRSLHAVHGVERAGDAPFRLATLDAPLVAVGEPQLLRFENRVATPDDGFHVNLHNNVWGTNFRMWFEDDLRYRFELAIG
jgi:hypothetical protein